MLKNLLRYLLLAAIILPAIGQAAPKEALLYVQVKESKLRSQPQFWASSAANLTYGDVLTALGAAPSDKSWIKVKKGDTEGYVHVAAVTKRKVILSSSTKGVQSNVDPSSVVMAGKGFNRQVENSYASKKGLDFKSVDKAEQNKVDPSDEAAFIKEGKLS